MYNSLELFSGAGGLAIGLENSGFSHKLLVERDPHACKNLTINKQQEKEPFINWNLYEGDSRSINYKEKLQNIEFVSGGPPCQPFSLGGKHNGNADTRDMFPEAVRAVRELLPKAFIFENVKGLLRKSFSTYFEYIVLQLTYPNIIRKKDERWQDHLSKIERHHTSKKKVEDVQYNVTFRLLNAADFGIPQKRYRVFIIGFRNDLDIKWSFPDPTHFEEKLLIEKWVTKNYWDKYNIPRKNQEKIDKNLENKIERLKTNYLFSEFPGKAWRTVRDVIYDLPDPEKNNNILNHEYRAGAKVYPGHTGSFIDQPAKTLKAGAHGVPGGENMLRLNNDSVRYFTVRESARIQTFPDNYYFSGSWTENMRQIGNAVPVKLAEIIGKNIFSKLKKAS